MVLVDLFVLVLGFVLLELLVLGLVLLQQLQLRQRLFQLLQLGQLLERRGRRLRRWRLQLFLVERCRWAESVGAVIQLEECASCRGGNPYSRW